MKKSDTMVIRDRTGRREFFRAGAVFVLAGSSIGSGIAQAQEQPIRTDCDSLGFSGEKNTEVAGNDSDTGAAGDRPGCGRRNPPALSNYQKKNDGTVRVNKVKV